MSTEENWESRWVTFAGQEALTFRYKGRELPESLVEELLNAYEAAAEALPRVTEIADWYAGEHEFGTMDAAPITRAQDAIKRLRELREGKTA